MALDKTLVVFSDNRDTKGIYQAFAAQAELRIIYKDRSKSSLITLLEQKIDLIIIEVMQPIMSEIDFVDQIYGVAKRTPIILISSYFYDTKDIVFGERIADFILKPLELEKLIDSSEKFLKEKPFEAAFVEVKKSAIVVDDVVQENKKLSVLLEISKSLNSKTNFDELLNHIITLAADALNSERATLFIVDKKKKELWSRSGIGIEQKEIRIPLVKGIAGEVATTGISQIINDPYKNNKFNKDVDLKTGFKTRNILTYPMKNITCEVIGVFQILNKNNGDFTKEDEMFLSAMASSTGIAIENALLHDELKTQLDKTKEAYNDLYIAQNVILKETKLSTLSEILGYTSNELNSINSNDKPENLLTNYILFGEKIKKYLEQLRDKTLGN